MPRNDDMSLILAKAKANGFFPDVKDDEVSLWENRARLLFGDDPVISQTGRIPKAGAGVSRRLKDKSAPAVVSVIGDSTGDEATEWFETLTDWLRSQAPNSTSKICRWTDVNQGYSLPFTQQVGTEEASVVLNGTHYIVTPDSIANSLTGDMAIAIDFAAADWTSATFSPALLTKFGSAGQRSFRFFVEQTTGLLVFAWYPDGTNAKTVKSSVAPTIADGSRIRLGVELDADDGAGSHWVKFYVGTGQNGWVQLGTTQVAAGGGVTSIFDSTTQLAIGARSDASVDNAIGTFYSCSLVSGRLQTGKIVANYDPGLYPTQGGDAILKGITGETWTPVGNPTINYSPILLVFNGSASGKNITYGSDDTRLALLTPIEPNIFFISYGHNETWSVLSTWDALATKFRTRYPLCPIVGVTQNPQKSPRLVTQVARQQQIAAEVTQLTSLRGYGLLDAFTVLSSNPDLYVLPDGVHPTVEGSRVWGEEAKLLFLPWPTY